MQDIQSINEEYQKSLLNKKVNFCHSIDIETYKILCKEYFGQKECFENSISLANYNLQTYFESEDIFLDWLNLE